MAEQYTHFKALTAGAFILIKATIIIAAVVVEVAAIVPSAVSILQQLVMRPFCCLIRQSIFYSIRFGFLEASREDSLCPKPIRRTAT
jgi:hypothetical protein